MELIQKRFLSKVKQLIDKIVEDNLFLLSSSMSFYSALAITPFVLILLGVASLLGQDIQTDIINQSYIMSPQVGRMVTSLFEHVNKRVSFGSLSGLIGVTILLYTSSLVFLQIRYSLDVIYGNHDSKLMRGFWEIVRERLFAMLVVLLSGVFFLVSIFLSTVVGIVFTPNRGHDEFYRGLAFIFNFFIYIGIFSGIYYFAPSHRPQFNVAFKTSTLTAVFFILGNLILSSYLKSVAADNIYGAAGTLLIFLLWSYYSSFVIFLSVEVFLYLKERNKLLL